MTQLPKGLDTQRLARLAQPRLVAVERVRRDVFVDGVEQELPSSLGGDDERVGLDFSRAMRLDVLLDVRLVVVAVRGVGKVLVAAGRQPVDPRQVVRVDEVAVQAEAIHD